MREYRIQSAVLRVAGAFDADSLAEELGFELCREFARGDVIFGRVNDRHRANILVSDGSTVIDACRVLVQSVEKLSPEYMVIWRRIEKTIDLAVHTQPEAAASFLQIDAESVRKLSSIGVGVEVSSYSCSE